MIVLDAKHGIPLHRVSSRSTRSSEPVICDRTPIPDWNQPLESGLKAHDQYTSIYAITWDFAITERGPVLLEGNAGWGVEIPQMTHEPLSNPGQRP